MRSTAAKNAILALGDLYSSLKTGMDPEINSSSSILIKVSPCVDSVDLVIHRD